MCCQECLSALERNFTWSNMDAKLLKKAPPYWCAAPTSLERASLAWGGLIKIEHAKSLSFIFLALKCLHQEDTRHLILRLFFSKFAYTFSLWWQSQFKMPSAVMMGIFVPGLNKRAAIIRVTLSDNHLPCDKTPTLALHLTMGNDFIFMEVFQQVLLQRRQSDTTLGNSTGKSQG